MHYHSNLVQHLNKFLESLLLLFCFSSYIQFQFHFQSNTISSSHHHHHHLMIFCLCLFITHERADARVRSFAQFCIIIIIIVEFGHASYMYTFLTFTVVDCWIEHISKLLTRVDDLFLHITNEASHKSSFIRCSSFMRVKHTNYKIFLFERCELWGMKFIMCCFYFLFFALFIFIGKGVKCLELYAFTLFFLVD
jgi:hypothetical protein